LYSKKRDHGHIRTPALEQLADGLRADPRLGGKTTLVPAPAIQNSLDAASNLSCYQDRFACWF
jgi:hypothetical protein